MSLATPCSSFTTECINPVISATRNVFQMMLDCNPRRVGLELRGQATPRHEVSAVIGITGKATGTIVVSLSQETACAVLQRMTGLETETVTTDVCDAVGELTNMIAGGAKSQLAHLELSISIPNMVSGRDHTVHYPSDVTPFCIMFESEIGPFMIEVGFALLG